MADADLAHLLKSRHLWTWLAVETILVLIGLAVFLVSPDWGPILGVPIFCVALFCYAALSLGIAFSSVLQRTLVRPEAIVETHHKIFLTISGVFSLVWIVLLIVFLFAGTAE